MLVPWIADGIDSGEESAALDYLPTLAHIDLRFAKAVLGLAWTADGWDHRERQALGRIVSIFNPNQTYFPDPNRIIYLDASLALQLVSFPWFTDSINGHELSALGELRGMVSKDTDLGRRILGFGWFRDNITDVEARAVHHLHRITLHNVHLARQVLNYSWVADGITESEVASLASMAPWSVVIARTRPEHGLSLSFGVSAPLPPLTASRTPAINCRTRDMQRDSCAAPVQALEPTVGFEPTT